MKKICVLLILPDFKNENSITIWEENVKWANENSIKYPYITDKISTEQRWAIGYVYWQKLIEYFNKLGNIDVYFVRTDYRLLNSCEIKDNIISIKFNNSYGHIIYKTIIGFKLLADKYDYFVRGNINTIIDINYLEKFVRNLPSEKIFTSPFWEGGDYPFGYFMLLSKDVVEHIINKNFDKRWLNEDTADDYELTRVILKNFNYFIISGCDRPCVNMNLQKPLISDVNRCGINFDGYGRNENYSKNIIDKIKKSSDLIFLYRIRESKDCNYFEIYETLIKKIWNKVVKNMFGYMKIYNENNEFVPHLEYERDEQLLSARYIEENDIVLELGARYGSVSCIINYLLNDKKNQVSVEPDNTVWTALEKNRYINKCSFHIFKGIVSKNNYQLKLNGYGSTIDIENKLNNSESINTQNMSLEQIQSYFGLKFNVLVADCEGFLEKFLNENKILYTQLDKIIFECDRADICDYNKIKTELINNGFKIKENGFQCVFIK